MFVTNWISTTKIQKISEITNFFRHYFLSRTEVGLQGYPTSKNSSMGESQSLYARTIHPGRTRLQPIYQQDLPIYIHQG